MFKNFELKYCRKMRLKQRMGEKSNMLAIEESEKSQKGSRILMSKNFELKFYRKMGLKQRMGEKSNMLAMEENEKSLKKDFNVQEF